jgi:2-polyprenyl-3-methyl-5-hydroxy-6-metoxy-1,4-benzoquinol methylase
MTDSTDSCSIPCNLCGSTDVEEIANTDRDGRPLRTVICRDCGLVWTDPRPDSEANRKFYADDYRVAYKGAFQPKLKHAYREIGRAWARYERLKERVAAGDRLLDVGSGGGFFNHIMQRVGLEVHGIEPNFGFGSYAIDELDVPTTIGFIQDAGLAPHSFDFVTINHVLEHLEDPCQVLTQLAGLLKPEGILVVEVPNVEATYHAPGNLFHLGHLYNFNPENLAAMAAKAGLGVVDLLLQPGTAHINLMLKPLPGGPEQRDSWALPGNYDKVMAVLRHHTTLQHYLSAAPYTRLFGKLRQYREEKHAVRDFHTGREVVDAFMAEHLR